MPAKSVKQQRFMGMVEAAKEGKLANPSPAVQRVAKSKMTTKQVEEFASTPTAGLPNKVPKTGLPWRGRKK